MEFDKKKGINGSSLNFNIGNAEEKFLVGIFGQINERLREKFNYSEEEILRICNNGNALMVPVSIFSGKLSPAEALAKFLREKHELDYRQISGLIGRDERSIWANYKRAVKKMPWPIEANGSVAVPVSIFKSEKSILEALVSYLKEVKKLRNKKIAQLLNKNPANIWTVNSRAKKKENNDHKNAE